MGMMGVSASMIFTPRACRPSRMYWLMSSNCRGSSGCAFRWRSAAVATAIFAGGTLAEKMYGLELQRT